MILVPYPSRSALIQKVQSSEYEAIAHLRRDTLTSTLLAPVTPWQRRRRGSDNANGSSGPSARGVAGAVQSRE